MSVGIVIEMDLNASYLTQIKAVRNERAETSVEFVSP